MESTTLGFGEASWQRSPGTQPEVEGTDLVRQLACNHAWKERNKFTSSAPTVKWSTEQMYLGRGWSWAKIRQKSKEKTKISSIRKSLELFAAVNWQWIEPKRKAKHQPIIRFLYQYQVSLKSLRESFSLRVYVIFRQLSLKQLTKHLMLMCWSLNAAAAVITLTMQTATAFESML